MAPTREKLHTILNPKSKRYLKNSELRDRVVSALKRRIDEFKSRIEKELSQRNETNQRLYDEMKEIILANWDTLIEPGRKSFATLHAVFMFREVKEKVKLKGDGKAKEKAETIQLIRARALRQRNWSEISDEPSRERPFNEEKFLAKIMADPDFAKRFEDLIVREPAGLSMSIRPNNTYVETYDNSRITPPPVPRPKS